MNRGGGSEGALIMPKLPKVPQSENNYLGSDDGGRPSWKKMPTIPDPQTPIPDPPSGTTYQTKVFDVCENGQHTQYTFLIAT